MMIGDAVQHPVLKEALRRQDERAAALTGGAMTKIVDGDKTNEQMRLLFSGTALDGAADDVMLVCNTNIGVFAEAIMQGLDLEGAIRTISLTMLQIGMYAGETGAS